MELWKRPRCAWIKTERIEPPEFLSARAYDRERIGRLAGSIRENGMISPLLVSKQKGGFKLIAGARRLRAAKQLGLERVLCVILPERCASEALTISLAENLEREPLHFFEQATMLHRALTLGETDRMALSERLLLTPKEIKEKLCLLSFNEREIGIALDARFTERQLRAILRLPESGREELLIEAASKCLDEEQVERRVSDLLELYYIGPSRRQIVIKDVRIFLNTVTRAVEVMNDAGLDATAERRDREGYLEYIVRIPMNGATQSVKTRRNA